MKTSNFYRAIGVPEYQTYKDYGCIIDNREWVELGLEKEGGFRFLYIKMIVDSGGWKRGVNYSEDIPRDIIIKVNGSPTEEFIVDPFYIPKRYVNRFNMDFSRAKIVYDPRGMIVGSRVELSEELIPELKEFDLEKFY